MKTRKRSSTLQTKTANKNSLKNLKRSDRSVLKYLYRMTQKGNGKDCIVSIPKIANACDICERQVQISTKRLINAGLIKRVGYDFSNSDRTKRGTIYKVLISKARAEHCLVGKDKKSAISFFLFWSED